MSEQVLRREEEGTDFPQVSQQESDKGSLEQGPGLDLLHLFLALQHRSCSGFSLS